MHALILVLAFVSTVISPLAHHSYLTTRKHKLAAAVEPSPKKLREMFATFTDAELLAEVDRRGLTEHVRHAAVEAQVRANYQLGEVLGEGSSAKVYSATHLLTGEGFAIKWINKGGEMNDAASMRAELSILKQVRVCTAAAPEPPFRCCQPSTQLHV